MQDHPPRLPGTADVGQQPTSSNHEGTATTDAREQLRLLRDAVLNVSGHLATGLVTVLLVPVMLKGLGIEPYGLLITALTVGGLFGLLDLGLGFCVTREVAAGLSTGMTQETARFVAAVGRAYFVLGVTGAGLIGFVGLFLSGRMHLSPSDQRMAPLVFGLAGLAFLGDQLLFFATAVLNGLRRFDTSNLLYVVAALLRAAGIVALLAAGLGLMAVAVWHVASALFMGLGAFRLVQRLEPRFRWMTSGLNRKSLREHLSFGLASQLANAAVRLLWDVPTLMISLLLGPYWVVPYYIGSRFPLAIGNLSWRAAQVLFPAASEQQPGGDISRLRGMLEMGTRGTLALVLPTTLVLCVLAPDLLRVWVGQTRPETLHVLWLATAAVLADSVGVGGLHILWGRAALRTVLAVLGGMAVGGLGLSVFLVGRLGIVSVGWAMLLSMIAGSLAFLHFSSRICRRSAAALLSTATEGLLFPGFVCLSTAYAISHFVRPRGWFSIILVAAGSALMYLGTFYVKGARAEERAVVRTAIQIPLATARATHAFVKRQLSRG